MHLKMTVLIEEIQFTFKNINFTYNPIEKAEKYTVFWGVLLFQIRFGLQLYFEGDRVSHANTWFLNVSRFSNVLSHHRCIHCRTYYVVNIQKHKVKQWISWILFLNFWYCFGLILIIIIFYFKKFNIYLIVYIKQFLPMTAYLCQTQDHQFCDLKFSVMLNSYEQSKSHIVDHWEPRPEPITIL